MLGPPDVPNRRVAFGGGGGDRILVSIRVFRAKTLSYLAVKVSFRVAHEKNINIYILSVF